MYAFRESKHLQLTKSYNNMIESDLRTRHIRKSHSVPAQRPTDSVLKVMQDGAMLSDTSLNNVYNNEVTAILF